jgi:hypothetical protein
MALGLPKLEWFNVTVPAEYVAHVEINRPSKLNAFHDPYVSFLPCFLRGIPFYASLL